MARELARLLLCLADGKRRGNGDGGKFLRTRQRCAAAAGCAHRRLGRLHQARPPMLRCPRPPISRATSRRRCWSSARPHTSMPVRCPACSNSRALPRTRCTCGPAGARSRTRVASTLLRPRVALRTRRRRHARRPSTSRCSPPPRVCAIRVATTNARRAGRRPRPMARTRRLHLARAQLDLAGRPRPSITPLARTGARRVAPSTAPGTSGGVAPPPPMQTSARAGTSTGVSAAATKACCAFPPP